MFTLPGKVYIAIKQVETNLNENSENYIVRLFFVDISLVGKIKALTMSCNFFSKELICG